MSTNANRAETVPTTLTGFDEAVQALVSNIKRITTPDANGFEKFPEFVASNKLRQQIIGLGNFLHDPAMAWHELASAKAHFNNAQAHYARHHLLDSLDAELGAMVNEQYFQGYIDKVRLAINAYRDLVGQGRFDLDKASACYHETLKVLDWAETEQGKRNALEKQRKEQEAAVRREQNLQQQKQREVARKELDRQRKEREAAENAAQAEQVGAKLKAVLANF